MCLMGVYFLYTCRLLLSGRSKSRRMVRLYLGHTERPPGCYNQITTTGEKAIYTSNCLSLFVNKMAAGGLGRVGSCVGVCGVGGRWKEGARPHAEPGTWVRISCVNAYVLKFSSFL